MMKAPVERDVSTSQKIPGMLGHHQEQEGSPGQGLPHSPDRTSSETP